MKQKQRLKLILCLIILPTMLLLYGCNVKEEKTKVFENGLNAEQNTALAICYKLGCNQKSIYNLEEAENLEFNITEYTEKLVAAFNFKVWDYKTNNEYSNKKLNECRKVCEKYGITNENRLTSSWVLKNQNDAYNLMMDLPESNRELIIHKYDEIYEENGLDKKDD